MKKSNITRRHPVKYMKGFIAERLPSVDGRCGVMRNTYNTPTLSRGAKHNYIF